MMMNWDFLVVIVLSTTVLWTITVADDDTAEGVLKKINVRRSSNSGGRRSCCHKGLQEGAARGGFTNWFASLYPGNVDDDDDDGDNDDWSLTNKISMISDPNDSKDLEPRGKNKYKKKFKKLLLPLLLAYKLKFFTLIPVLIGGLVLLTGATGLAGFFFALFAAVMGLKSHGSHS